MKQQSTSEAAAPVPVKKIAKQGWAVEIRIRPWTQIEGEKAVFGEGALISYEGQFKSERTARERAESLLDNGHKDRRARQKKPVRRKRPK
jgi:hypothetical protein